MNNVRMQGSNFSGINNQDSTVVMGDIISHGGVTINSRAATSTAASGQTKVFLRPVATYVARPVLYEQLKARLHNTVDVRGKSKIVVICGLGGAGKSQLALNYIQTHRQDYVDVFWIEAGTKATLERDYIQTYCRLSRSNAEKVSINDAIRGVKECFQAQTEDKKWMLVFDSADSIDNEAHKDYVDLNTFIPDAACADVIITTRSQTAKDMTDIEAVQVGDLNETEALQLLLRCSKIVNVTEDQKQQAVLIVKELGNFALAVALAGSYIAATPRIRSRLDLYLAEYRECRKTLLERKAHRQVHHYGESVLTTWETSYAAIADQCPEALGLLRLLAFLSSDDIFYELFTPLLDRGSKRASIWSGLKEPTDKSDVITRKTLDDGLEMLFNYSLLSWKEEQESYAMHKLVHTWGYERTTVKEQSDHSQEALQFVGSLLTWQEYNPTLRARLLPHLMTCFLRLQERYDGAEPMSEETLHSLDTGCDFLGDNGHFERGAQLCKFSCRAWMRLYNDDAHEAVLSAEARLAVMYLYQENWNEAEPLNKSILARRKKVLGEEHPLTLTSINNLAATYQEQGRYGEAVELQMKVVEMRKRVMGEEHLNTLTSMGNLALAYSKQERYEEAVELQVKVMDMSKIKLGEEHLNTLTSMGNLADTYHDQKRYGEAVELQVKVVEMRKRVLGEEHPLTLTSMHNLAFTYHDQERYGEAIELLVKVVEMRKRISGEVHPSTLTSIHNLATTLFYLNRLQDAYELMKQCYQSQLVILGATHPDTSDSASWLRRMEKKLHATKDQETVMDSAELAIDDADCGGKDA